MAFICPVCYLPLLAAPPEQGPVCPACGTEFEIDDRYKSVGQLRAEWVRAGAPWFSSLVKPPAQWLDYRSLLLAAHGIMASTGAASGLSGR